MRFKQEKIAKKLIKDPKSDKVGNKKKRVKNSDEVKSESSSYKKLSSEIKDQTFTPKSSQMLNSYSFGNGENFFSPQNFKFRIFGYFSWQIFPLN